MDIMSHSFFCPYPVPKTPSTVWRNGCDNVGMMFQNM